MSDLFGNHIVGFPTRRLIYRLDSLKGLYSPFFQQPEFYGDLVYKFKEPFFFSVQKNHSTLRNRRIRYNLNIM